jgi:hypothetical protein
MKFSQWTMTPYGNASGELDGGRYTISNGHLRFDVHLSVNGSRHETTEQYIVSPEQAHDYAFRIMNALNNREIHI